MRFTREMPVEIVDELPLILCRLDFLRASVAALALLKDGELDAISDSSALQGLACWLQDLEDLISRVNKLASSC